MPSKLCAHVTAAPWAADGGTTERPSRKASSGKVSDRMAAQLGFALRGHPFTASTRSDDRKPTRPLGSAVATDPDGAKGFDGTSTGGGCVLAGLEVRFLIAWLSEGCGTGSCGAPAWSSGGSGAASRRRASSVVTRPHPVSHSASRHGNTGAAGSLLEAVSAGVKSGSRLVMLRLPQASKDLREGSALTPCKLFT